ncbi:protein tyrosine phosphatase [Nitrosococcus oceani ATCC 19707]|uniref:protein-tyrosine-phosphatase n=2 Tax=Nitrosococcus oceani TaxID=1229 RepID=Q3J7A8_NITOC|nr:low molecular weight protein-tyrosine-phosphatase [Nitrosococcus oceani]ABA59288.1 protein tyrosine phosphatase [Nitrosococcus oceani ATCC 19707]EDZ65394.1 Low molecular weight phosphotyrosine protein phosphatase [Nitrosococcus oceani AFC27]KFI18316.1 phosphotyrosine protein phosphatase [Nitrosococcus oceani C-27]
MMILREWFQGSKQVLPRSSEDKIGVLFVCMANFCRSPMAKGLFQQLVAHHHLSHAIFVDAAGTHGHFAGERPDPRARTCCRRRGIDIDRYRARQIQPIDFIKFDYLIAMDHSNLAMLKKLTPEGQARKIRLLLELAPHLRRQDVPDPYYGPPSEFEASLDLIEEAAHSLLNEIRQRHLSSLAPSSG